MNCRKICDSCRKSIVPFWNLWVIVGLKLADRSVSVNLSNLRSFHFGTCAGIYKITNWGFCRKLRIRLFMELLNVFQHSVLNSVVKGFLTTGSFQKENFDNFWLRHKNTVIL